MPAGGPARRARLWAEGCWRPASWGPPEGRARRERRAGWLRNARSVTLKLSGVHALTHVDCRGNSDIFPKPFQEFRITVVNQSPQAAAGAGGMKL